MAAVHEPEAVRVEAREKVALLTGITGQDGSYLAELLLDKGYEVHGIIRRSSSFNTGRLSHLYQDRHEVKARLFLHYGDLSDAANLISILSRVRPSEVYNLGAQSHVKVSFEMSEYTANVDGLGTLRLLDAIRTVGLTEGVRFYQASTSELYGKVQETPQKETTPFYPRSPYAVAKQFAYWMVVNYREAYGIHASNGILFNHESPRRGPTFVTRKVTRAVARIKKGVQECLFLGNLDSLRDWGHARDYVYAMWLMLQQEKPDDFVLATGEQHSVKEFCDVTFAKLGMPLKWKGEGIDEVAVDATNEDRVLIRVDPAYFRPAEVETLLGNPAKAKEKLGWTPTTSFEALVDDMIRGETVAVETGKDNWT